MYLNELLSTHASLYVLPYTLHVFFFTFKILFLACSQ